MKYCNTCKEEKSIEEFSKNVTKKDGLASNCKGCCKAWREENKDKQQAWHKAYREENKDKLKAYREENKDKLKAYREENKDKQQAWHKAWREENKDKTMEYNKAYHEENKDKRNEYSKIYNEENRDKRNERITNRYQQDPLFAITLRIRCAIRGALQKKGYRKSSNTTKILECSFDEFRMHIENQFHSGMSWDNRELWHLDHIVPVSFGANKEEIIRLNHYSNFRPLWAEENLEKKDKLTEEALLHPIYHELIASRM